jgi:5-methyltetrahydrofolate--homocysteine methyltransferase
MYGYWPCQSEGNDLVMYQPATIKSANPIEITRFNFPRQDVGENLCLSDYFSSKESGIMDIVALQIVTVGQAATDRFDRLQRESNYSEGYFTHGLAVQTAEAAAEYLHRHIRRELGLEADQGKRYSWGYNTLPELSEHAKVFSLLPVEQELGMTLTTAFQLVPEQSTAAIILHHPQAKYFNIGESRIDMLMKD